MTTPKTLGHYLMPCSSYCCSSLTQDPSMLPRTALLPPHLHRGAHSACVFHPQWLAPGCSFLHPTRGSSVSVHIRTTPRSSSVYTELKSLLVLAFPVQNGISFYTDQSPIKCFFPSRRPWPPQTNSGFHF